MNDELLNVSYVEQVIDQVLIVLSLDGVFLTHLEKLEKIKAANIDVYEKLIKLIDKGMFDPNFDSNRQDLVKSLRK